MADGMIPSRRRALFGLLLAAPAIIAAPSLMKLSALIIPEPKFSLRLFDSLGGAEEWRFDILYGVKAFSLDARIGHG